MKKFIYPMENILKVKSKLEEQAKSEYSLVRSRLNSEEEILQELILKKKYYEQKLKNLINNIGLDFKEIRNCKKAVNILNNKIEQQKAIIIEIEKELELARIKLETAMIERKTQDNLKDKAFQEYKREYNVWENKEIDELNSYNYSNPM